MGQQPWPAQPGGISTEAFVTTFAPACAAWIRVHLAGDAARVGLDVDDVVQEVLARTWPRRGRFSTTGELFGYGTATARNLVRDQARSAYARRSWWTLRDRIDECAGDAAPDPADHALRQADAADVLRALSRLTPIDQQLLLDRYVDGARIPDLASRANVSVAAVAKRLERARNRLRAEFTHLSSFVLAIAPRRRRTTAASTSTATSACAGALVALGIVVDAWTGGVTPRPPRDPVAARPAVVRPAPVTRVATVMTVTPPVAAPPSPRPRPTLVTPVPCSLCVTTRSAARPAVVAPSRRPPAARRATPVPRLPAVVTVPPLPR